MLIVRIAEGYARTFGNETPDRPRADPDARPSRRDLAVDPCEIRAFLAERPSPDIRWRLRLAPLPHQRKAGEARLRPVRQVSHRRQLADPATRVSVLATRRRALQPTDQHDARYRSRGTRRAHRLSVEELDAVQRASSAIACTAHE